MNDFDFEELDKAVNQLGTKTERELGGPTPPVATPITVTPTPPSIAEPAKPAESKPEPPADAEPVSVAVPPKRRLGDMNSAPPKRRGSFMDIVPPTPTRRSPARVGVSLQPVSKPEEVVPEPPKPVEPEPVVTQATPQPTVAPEQPLPESSKAVERAEPQPMEPQSPPSSPSIDNTLDWPDPLDFHEEPTPDKQPEPAEPTSPFLAEAKVEKRPLGAFSNFKPEEPKVEETPPLLDVSHEPLLEADYEDEVKVGERAPLPPHKSDVESDPDESETKPDLHGAAMMSIPQQYRTEAKSTDKASRPVFDTKEYHPPLLDAASHEHRGGGSMWGKIFIAFVVLALLAVAGYFAYLYFYM